MAERPFFFGRDFDAIAVPLLRRGYFKRLDDPISGGHQVREYRATP